MRSNYWIYCWHGLSNLLFNCIWICFINIILVSLYVVTQIQALGLKDACSPDLRCTTVTCSCPNHRCHGSQNILPGEGHHFRGWVQLQPDTGLHPLQHQPEPLPAPSCPHVSVCVQCSCNWNIDLIDWLKTEQNADREDIWLLLCHLAPPGDQRLLRLHFWCNELNWPF